MGLARFIQPQLLNPKGSLYLVIDSANSAVYGMESCDARRGEVLADVSGCSSTESRMHPNHLVRKCKTWITH
jgi:hypothetical protein